MPEERWDLLIRGASVYDGTGAAPLRADVAVRGERIVAVGAPRGRAGVTVDAAGLALAPGFVDVHSHDDFAVVLEPEMDFKLLQGVTTDVVGNCGMGAAPLDAAAAFAQALHPGRELPGWDDYAGYRKAIDAAGPSLNVAVLVGHGTLRLAAMGAARREPDARELSRMRDGLSEGLAAGAVGFSTGLIYEPGRWAALAELVALAQEMSGSGGLYATHMRNEGGGLLEAVAEALEVGEQGGVGVQISHHKAAGRENWGKVRDSLARIDEARSRGVDVAADQYPYTSGSTILAAVVQNGGLASDARAGLGRVDPADVQIATAPSHPEYEGRTLAALCDEWSTDAESAAQRILGDDPGAWVVMSSMDEADVREVMRHPSTMIGSDGVPTDGGKPHPRLYGTFPRVLGRYVRDEGVLTLPDAVHRMTGLPAARFRLTDRGVLRAGAYADLVLFDPARIADVGTYQDPRRHPEGIVGVWVNGTAVVRDGRHTGARPGRTLPRG